MQTHSASAAVQNAAVDLRHPATDENKCSEVKGLSTELLNE